ncbi:hypothetical protein TNCV_1870941 [Trichonephila clavipes]|nr:hypothetical protein TNCV_1870941 [Trichonephila clavipes]
MVLCAHFGVSYGPDKSEGPMVKENICFAQSPKMRSNVTFNSNRRRVAYSSPGATEYTPCREVDARQIYRVLIPFSSQTFGGSPGSRSSPFSFSPHSLATSENPLHPDPLSEMWFHYNPFLPPPTSQTVPDQKKEAKRNVSSVQ